MVSVDFLLKKIRSEYVTNTAYRQNILRSCLNIILVELIREHRQTSDIAHRSIDYLYAEFLDLLEKSWQTNNTPKQFASILKVSPDHLAATLRKISGKNTSELIQERLLLESKRHLAHSRMSVSEIAYSVGFEDPSYFTRVFRKHEGITPKQFRNNCEENYGKNSELS